MKIEAHRVGPTNPSDAKPVVWLTLALGCSAIVSGCTYRAPLYDWGMYEQSLHASYVAQDEAQTSSTLEATVTSAEQSGSRIPPGVCAEYAFSLYKRGQNERAVKYFRKEAALFPESKQLMDKLIVRVQAKPPSDAPRPAEEITAP